MEELYLVPEIGEIATYLKNMKFKKKAVGGCDKDNVLDHFEEVTKKYETYIKSLLEKIEEKDNRLCSIQEKLEEEVKTRDLQAKTLEEQIKIADQAKRRETEYQKKSDQLAAMMVQIDGAREAILAQAQKEAYSILQEASQQSYKEQRRIDELVNKREELEREYENQLSRTRKATQQFRGQVQGVLEQIRNLEGQDETEEVG